MRLVSTNAIRFDLDIDSDAVLQHHIRQAVLDGLTTELKEVIIEQLSQNLMAGIDMNILASYMVNHISLATIAEHARRDIVSYLLNDERFNSRVMRHIHDATVGVTNETVERVTAVIQSQLQDNSDV